MVARNPGLRKRPRCGISYVGEGQVEGACEAGGVSAGRRRHVLGAPGRAWAAHIMQFRPVGVERPGEEGAPEGHEFGEWFCGAVRGRG
jgi:hypothetical protein